MKEWRTCLRASPSLGDFSEENIIMCPWFLAISQSTDAVRTVSFRACTNTITYAEQKPLLIQIRV